LLQARAAELPTKKGAPCICPDRGGNPARISTGSFLVVVEKEASKLPAAKLNLGMGGNVIRGLTDEAWARKLTLRESKNDNPATSKTATDTKALWEAFTAWGGTR